MNWLAALFVVIIIIFNITSSELNAQTAKKPSDQFYPELQNDADMEVNQTQRAMTKSGVQYGVWITPSFLFESSSTNKLKSIVTTSRIWLKTYLWGNSYLYIRGKDTYQAILSHSGTGSVHSKNTIDLDVGYINITNPRKNIDFSCGRKYFLVGSGLVFNGRGDGAEFNFYSPYINVKAFGSWTGWFQKDDNPYGLSDKDISTGSRRIFTGVTLSSRFKNQIVYLFGIAQFDSGKEYFSDTKRFVSYYYNFINGFRFYSQKSHYNSQYYGVGVNGVIYSGLSYSGEFILEQGKSYIAYTNVKKDIIAFASVIKIQYILNVILNPVFMAQYAFGSGDNNRDDYRQPTGNRYGKDRGFIYFGTFVGGYGLRPLLANMHVLSGGVTVSPFSWIKIYSLKSMGITAKYHYYLKHKTMAAINNAMDATRPSRRIGHGVDLSFRWNIFTDLSVFINYGLFIPGCAYGFNYNFTYGTMSYSSRVQKHLVMAGFNISF